jgi:hypothetical protein
MSNYYYLKEKKAKTTLCNCFVKVWLNKLIPGILTLIVIIVDIIET